MPDSINVSQIPRDPTQDPRTRRALQILSQLLNSLQIAGDIELTEPGKYHLTGHTDQTILANRIFSPKAAYGMFGG